jgi:transposase
MAARTARKGTSKYRVINWSEYEASLIRRGSVTFWFSEDAIANWKPDISSKSRGGQQQYSELAIQTCLTMRLIYGLALRQTEGFVNSLIGLLGADINCPDHTTMSRRTANLEVITDSLKQDGHIDILIDSTGLKVFGMGQWCEEKHGRGRRIWKKLHLAVDQKSQMIVASTFTTHLTGDRSQVLPLLDQIDSDVASVKADGAYDSDPLRHKLEAHGIQFTVPPPSDATLSKQADSKPTSRDKDIMRIEKDGREIWEYASGYSKRNMVENTMFRFKNNIGGKLRSRTNDRREVEVAIGIHLLNQMTKLGMPESVIIN